MSTDFENGGIFKYQCSTWRPVTEFVFVLVGVDPPLPLHTPLSFLERYHIRLHWLFFLIFAFHSSPHPRRWLSIVGNNFAHCMVQHWHLKAFHITITSSWYGHYIDKPVLKSVTALVLKLHSFTPPCPSSTHGAVTSFILLHLSHVIYTRHSPTTTDQSVWNYSHGPTWQYNNVYPGCNWLSRC